MLIGDVKCTESKAVLRPHAEDFLNELETLMNKYGIVKVDVAIDPYTFQINQTDN